MKISSIQDLEKLAIHIKRKISPGDYIFLYGEIGVGKTTFARIVINNLELENNLKISEVLSPTFNIVFEYDINNFVIKHYDLYRLKKEEDIKNLGIYENENECITIVEWPELIKDKPSNRIELFFKYTEDMNSRIIEVKSSGKLKDYEFK